MHDAHEDQTTLAVIAVAVGNSRTRIGLVERDGVSHAEAIATGAPGAPPDAGAIASASGAATNARASVIDSLVRAILSIASEHHAAPIVIASVNNRVADPLARALREEPSITGRVYRVGQDVAIPIRHALDGDGSTVGQDRLLCAIAAFETAKQACVVIDAGTAITVDFVDGQGVFQGGAIAPGITMMLRSLHTGTAALPLLAPEPLEPGAPAWGTNTKAAMQRGAHASILGLVHVLLERYAEAYGAYPQVIATGGDAPLLFKDEPLVEHVVTDLQLRGIWLACREALAGEHDGDPGFGSGADE